MKNDVCCYNCNHYIRDTVYSGRCVHPRRVVVNQQGIQRGISVFDGATCRLYTKTVGEREPYKHAWEYDALIKALSDAMQNWDYFCDRGPVNPEEFKRCAAVLAAAKGEGK